MRDHPMVRQGTGAKQVQKVHGQPVAHRSAVNSMWEKSLLAPPGQQPFFATIVHNWLQYLAFEPDPPIASPASPLPAIDFGAGPEQFAASNAVIGFKGNLSRFRDLGGRLIIYHGWADQSLMPAHTLAYWREAGQQFARSGQNQEQRNPNLLDEFARLFMVPGMLHCGGGPGATDIDYLTALERWVEHDQPPVSLLAYKVKDAVPTFVRQPRFPPPPETVEYTRRIFSYGSAKHQIDQPQSP
ncbi:MAG: tannase/feruloyl esterase family alpha/beta hydrolase [Gammaproteobacteria bacterium]